MYWSWATICFLMSPLVNVAGSWKWTGTTALMHETATGFDSTCLTSINSENGHDGDLHMKYLSDVKVPHTPPTKRCPEMYSTEKDMKWFYKSR